MRDTRFNIDIEKSDGTIENIVSDWGDGYFSPLESTSVGLIVRSNCRTIIINPLMEKRIIITKEEKESNA